MDYKKHYDLLVSTRLKLKDERLNLRKIRYKTKELIPKTYFENHHIIPKCLGGSNEKENLILFTAREHYIAHWLLSKIYPDTNLVSALWQMSHNTKNAYMEINSRKYELLKEIRSRKMSTRMKGENHPLYGKFGKDSPNFGKKWSDEKKERQKERFKGENHPGFGKHLSQEWKNNISIKLTGKNNPNYNAKSMTVERNERHSEFMTGKNNPMFGTQPWENPTCKKYGLEYNWYNLDIIYNIWLETNVGYVNLMKNIIKDNNKIKSSLRSFWNMIQWFKKHGDPSKNSTWIEFKINYELINNII